MGYPTNWTEIENEQMLTLSDKNEKQEILQPELLLETQSRNKPEPDKISGEKESSTVTESNDMREMRKQKEFTETPQGQQSIEYEKREHSSSLPNVPQGRTYENRYMGNYWIEEPDISRLVTGLENRVNRLKGLGNAIVPQIAELLFRQIKELI
jgi:DNA (cytosine-5)-methyltransferase 1